MVASIFSALHSTIHGKIFSFNTSVMKGRLFFSIQCHIDEKPIIENQIYSTFEDVEIEQVSAPIDFVPEKTIQANILVKEGDFFPLHTFEDISGSPFIKMLSQTSNLDTLDKMMFQIILKPVNTHNVFFHLRRNI